MTKLDNNFTFGTARRELEKQTEK